jgi:hypothetical protein
MIVTGITQLHWILVGQLRNVREQAASVANYRMADDAPALQFTLLFSRHQAAGYAWERLAPDYLPLKNSPA